MVPFEYLRPPSSPQAVAACHDDARYLAGGQSLVQAMKLRMSSSQRLVDLAAVDGLQGVRVDGQAVVIGAMTRHQAVADAPAVRSRIPGLAELAGGIGDPAVRQWGTLGGSIANADPAACYPAGLLALQAQVRTDRRTLAAEDFFTGIYQTALEPGELVLEVRFAVPQRSAYAKFRQSASRFALVGVFVAQGPDGVRVAVTGARDRVHRLPAMEAALAARFTPEAARSVAVDPAGLQDDLHASADYRAAMISVMASRAVAAALSR